MDRSFFIYKTVCLVTGRYYIGAHETDNIEDDYKGSGKILRRSIAKYGVENHVREILSFHPSRVSLMEAEKLAIYPHLNNPLCMNIREGGNGGFAEMNSCSRHQRAANVVSKAVQDGLRLKPEWVEKKRARISEAVALAYAEGRKQPNTPDWSGRRHTHESRDKMREARKGTMDGSKNINYGRVWISHLEEGRSQTVPTDQLDDWLLKGWIKGRRMKWR